ncbi:hypothetical protein D3C86_1687840 [compost metagenome]
MLLEVADVAPQADLQRFQAMEEHLHESRLDVPGQNGCCEEIQAMSPDMRALLVYSNATLVGALFEENKIWGFRYDGAWVSKPDAYPLAPSLPLGLD